MSTKLIFIIILLLSSGSCSLFINKIDDDLLNKQTVSYKKTKKSESYCKKTDRFEFISEDKKSQRYFTKFLDQIGQKRKLTYADKVVLWSLVQMNIRPNHSSPTSKIQFLIKKNSRTYFYHVFSNKEKRSYPYLHGLNTLLNKFGTNHGLRKLGRIIDQEYNSQFFVSEFFADFIKDNKKEISNNKYLKRAYLRGDETLQKGERIIKQLISPLISDYFKTRTKDLYSISNYLFSYKRNNNIKANCNYDMGLYNSSIYLIHDQVIKSNTFGFRDRGNIFLADSTQEFSKISPIKNTLFFEGKSNGRSPAICQFDRPLLEDWDLWLISSQSRDPGQHLFHLIEYGLQDIKEVKQISSMLNFSRHLFLKKPIRLIFESERSSSEQLNELLKLNMPIYNAEKLARIWGLFKNNKIQQFLLDQRRTGSLSCQ